MEFLYGDSTPSSLTTDFVDLLRKVVDCCVSMLQAEQQMAVGIARRQQLEGQAERDAASLRELEATLSRAIGLVIAGASPDAPVARCSDVISRASSGAVTAAEVDVQAALTAELNRIEQSAARERGRCVKALELLLLEHDLPGSELELRVEQKKEGGHAARLHANTAYGVSAALELEIPPSHRFGQVVRVGDLVEALEIQVPKTGGWLRKESRLTPEKLARFLVTSCRIGPQGKQVSIRAEALEEGYDFSLAPGATRVHATRVAPELPSLVDFELSDADARAVAVLVDKVVHASQELARNRKALAAALLDGEPLEKHRQPSLLVHRLIEVMAPTVREIAARSGSDSELVIRRQLGDGRREERFVRRAELLEKLEPLSAPARSFFAPLGLGLVAVAPPAEEVSEEISGGFIMEESVVEGSSPGTRPPPLRSS